MHRDRIAKQWTCDNFATGGLINISHYWKISIETSDF